MPGGETAVAVLRPAVNRYAVLPRTDVQAASADLISRDPIGDDHGCFGMRGEDQPVNPVEQGTVPGVDAIDITPYRFIHGVIMASMRALKLVSGLRHNHLRGSVFGLHSSDD